MRPPVIVVDRSNKPPQRGHYLMRVECCVCGEAHVALLSKGQPYYHESQLCPYCETRGQLRYLHTRLAIAMLLDQYYTVWIQTPDGIGPACTCLPVSLPDYNAVLDDVLSGARGEV